MKEDSLRSEFNMSIQELERLDDLLKEVMILFLRVPDEPRVAPTLVNALQEFYKIILPLLNEEEEAQFDKRFSDLRKEVLLAVKRIDDPDSDFYGERSLKSSLYDKLNKIDKDLRVARQRSGAGLAARIQRKKGAGMKDAMGI